MAVDTAKPAPVQPATPSASAADHSRGIAPPAVTMPTGGGAIRGIGEKFAANPVTGAASLAVPLGLPEARTDLGLNLVLGYDSTAGNGPFGMGWQLSVPLIARRTDKGVPRYGDDDVFVLSGTEDLVAVPGPDTIRNGYAIRRYRPRIEVPFARTERWTRLADGDVHWRTLSRENLLTVFGADIGSRVADPADPGKVFAWLICARYDDKGNAAVFEYAAEDDAGVDLAQAHERNRTGRDAGRYLKRIRYGNRKPLLLDPTVPGLRGPHLPAPDTTEAGWMFEVVFDYGEGHYHALPADGEGRVSVEASPGADRPWPVRADPFSRYRSGFEVRAYRLCRAVLVFHRFPDELGVQAYLARAMHLRYDESPVGSFLRTIVSCGYVRQQDGSYLERGIPALSVEYTTSPLAEAGDVVCSSGELADVAPAAAYRFVDVDGDGIPGILHETASAWLYQPNLGAGRLGPLALLPRFPAAATASAPTRRLLDLGGDGTMDLVEFGSDGPGFYGRTPDAGWAPFRPFDSWPRPSWADARLIDVTGDGLADLLIAGDDHVVWHASLGGSGFAAAVRVPLPPDEENGPRVVFADPTLSLHLADVSGDGLPDIVRVRNGDVCYWPNLGYGRFGAKVTMDRAPHFDRPERFDARRIRLADTDGSGTTDLIYLGADSVAIYLNEAGNNWSAARTLPPLPAVASGVQVADVLGRGTACLVWSESDPLRAQHPMSYLDLMSGRKPHLLNRISNGMGAEIAIEYAASTEFYLADKAAGTPWVTRLPFPVHVVRRVDRYDHIGRNRYVTRYTYRHGYFDGAEREWRGFGRVDQVDTEELAALSSSTDLSQAANLDEASHVPPVQTRSWYHTGAYLAGGLISRHLAEEYYREPGDADPQLDDTILPTGLSATEYAEACRALKGQLLRREVYAHDGTEAAQRPYTVLERNYTIRPLQERVYLVHARETINLHYERRLYPTGDGPRADPRILHDLTLDVDDFGTVLLSASVAYGRLYPDPDPRLSDADRRTQATTSTTFTTRAVTQPVDAPDTWRTPLPAETATYQLHRATPTGRRYALDELRALIESATDVAYEDGDTAEEGSGVPHRRRLDVDRVIYRRNDLAGPLPLGQLESLALPYDTYRLALTPGLLSTVYGPKLSPTQQKAALTEGGLVQLPDGPDWWVPGSRVHYSTDAGATPAAELATASQHFFQGSRYSDPFGNDTVVDYDPHDLYVVQAQDSVGNVTRSVHNYRVLQPTSIMDANRNRRTVAFDALGMVAGTAVMGKPEESLGDSLAGFAADLTDAAIAAHMADPRATASALLGRATSRMVYDLHAFARTGTAPVAVSAVTRETHDADPGGAASVVRCRLTYADGTGNRVQEKVEAEQNQWVATGWVIRDNKGSPVRQYEPFFDSTHAFAFGTLAGVSAITCYDPLERAVAVLTPQHAWRKTVFDPWRQEMWDVNDTVLVADPAGDPDVGDHFRRQPAEHYLPTWYAARVGGALGTAEQDAATKAAQHAGTPTLIAVDPLGRTFLLVDHNGEAHLKTRLILDIEGNERTVVDAQGRIVTKTVFDVLGNKILTEGMDAGERRTLHDVNGELVRQWDGRGHAFVVGYDGLRRVVQRSVRGTDGRSDPRTLGKDVVYERTVYGEGQPGDLAHNLRTRVVAIHDGAGVDGIDSYDFKGNALHHIRQFTADHVELPDWSASPTLDGEVWHNRTTFDALNRPVTMSTPDGSITRVSYSARGLVAGIDVAVRGASSPTTFVTSVSYNARGQETEVVLGNGATMVYSYDPLTARPTRLTTTRPSTSDTLASHLFVDAATVQDLTYTYDPVGNITRLANAALRTVFFQNSQVEPVFDYAYEPVYRLASATGREQDGQVVRAYTERYTYDATGNITSLQHAVSGGGYTRTYSYQEQSGLEPGRFGDRLSSVGAEAYTHDEHGSLTSTPQLSVLRWDFAGRLYASSRQVVNGGGGSETTYYTYSSTGRRLRKVTERANQTRRTARLYLRGSELYREYAGDGSAVTLARESLHVMAASRRVALMETQTIGGGQVVAVPVPEARFQFGDHLDSVTLELDAAGALISFEQFTPYGATAVVAGRSDVEVSLKRYRYTGRERDEETGFGYHGARYYASWLGRWTACDPAGLVDGPNLYQYAHGNPVRMRDPSGTQAAEHHRVADGSGPAQQQTTQAPVKPAAKKDDKDRWTSTPPSNRPATHLYHTPGLRGTTKVEWRHWPGTQYDKETGQVKSGPTWATWLVAGLFIGLMVFLMSITSRKDKPQDPAAYNIVKWSFTGAVGAFVAFRLILEGTVSKTPEGEEPKWDKQFGDPWWTTIHTSVGLLMGLWQVPFPLVALATVFWEGVEIAAPGFGDHEINGNRMSDIGVAWLGWVTTASIASAWTKAPFPHGFDTGHYSRDR